MVICWICWLNVRFGLSYIYFFISLPICFAQCKQNSQCKSFSKSWEVWGMGPCEWVQGSCSGALMAKGTFKNWCQIMEYTLYEIHSNGLVKTVGSSGLNSSRHRVFWVERNLTLFVSLHHDHRIVETKHIWKKGSTSFFPRREKFFKYAICLLFFDYKQ
jgi:hypothetical protein